MRPVTAAPVRAFALLALLCAACAQDCTVPFKGDEIEFTACRKDLGAGVEVYWRLRLDDDEIDTLVRAPDAEGYVGFGWGYKGMVGSNAAIVYQSPTGQASIDDYFMEARSSAGVQPNDNQKLTNLDAEVAGGFLAGVFSRKLVQAGVPDIASGDVDIIWAVGEIPSSRTTLPKHTVLGTAVLVISTDQGVVDGGNASPSAKASPTANASPAVDSSPSTGASPLPTPSTSPSPAISPGGVVVPPTSCNVTFKGEERSFRGCRNLTAGVEVYWTIRGEDGEIDTLFRAPTKGGYVGFGWGYLEMTGSNVVIAFEDEGVRVEIGDYFLEARSQAGVRPANRQKLIFAEGAMDGDYVVGMFTRSLAVSGLPTIVNGTMEAIWAVGEKPRSADSLEEHGAFGSGTIDLSVLVGGLELKRKFSRLYTVHGVFMAVSWFILLPTAVITMRFFKKYNPLAFQIHRAINIVAALLVIAAFIMGVSRGTHTRKAHLAIGCLVFIFTLLQVAGGILRPKEGHRARRPWFWAHLLIGYAAVGLSNANVWLGLSIMDAGNGYWIACGVVIGIAAVVYIGLFFSSLVSGGTGHDHEGEVSGAVSPEGESVPLAQA